MLRLTVLQHHERENGSGYPGLKQRNDICDYAHAIGLPPQRQITQWSILSICMTDRLVRLSTCPRLRRMHSLFSDPWPDRSVKVAGFLVQAVCPLRVY